MYLLKQIPTGSGREPERARNSRGTLDGFGKFLFKESSEFIRRRMSTSNRKPLNIQQSLENGRFSIFWSVFEPIERKL